MKSPLRSSSLFGYRPSDYLGGNRIENICHFWSNLHVCTCVLFLQMLCHQETLPFWEIFSCRISQAPPPFFFYFIFFVLFSYSFLHIVLEEGPGFFHSQCKTVQRTESALCESHILVSLHLERSSGSVNGEVLALETLSLVWAPKFVQAGDVKRTHALWTASGYSNPEFE